MGWDIYIDAPDGFPDVQEEILGVSSCKGNFYVAIQDLKGKQLRHMEKDEAISSLIEVIAEVDKGDQGLFSNQYAIDGDQQWSNGRESNKEFDRYRNILKYMPFKTYEEFCGWKTRDRIRKAAVRFLLYYASGYRITYIW